MSLKILRQFDFSYIEIEKLTVEGSEMFGKILSYNLFIFVSLM